MENREKIDLLRKTIKQIATIEWFGRKTKKPNADKTISVGTIQINIGDMSLDRLTIIDSKSSAFKANIMRSIGMRSCDCG